MSIVGNNVEQLLKEIPPGVKVIAAAKGRSGDSLQEVLEAGITILGENYLQETLKHRSEIKYPAQWHCIGHLQKNKIKKAVEVFDLIQTVDSIAAAEEINKHCASLDKTLPVFIEVNSAREPQKSGIYPEKVEELVRHIAALPYLKIRGLMTMGPLEPDPEDIRPYFRATKQLFEQIKDLNIPGAQLEELSMGMSDSYRIAIEEQATMVRIGTKIFGERKK